MMRRHKTLALLSAAGFLSFLSHHAASSTVSAISVPLAKVVSQSQLIVIGSVERIPILHAPDATKHDPGLRYFEVRVEEVLKPSRNGSAKSPQGATIPIFDPQETFYHERADLIAAEVISFADPRYPTKARPIAAGDRLVFFLAAPGKPQKSPLPGAYFLACGQAYDTLAIKPAVLKLLKEVR
ncbi:MAG: hypothetical protein DLM73_04535 [Chthoniobacterales bacterium]|nr:MAG: hypothetical protein DLM73_04535 [Chthoniobacterales bacterium]